MHYLNGLSAIPVTVCCPQSLGICIWHLDCFIVVGIGCFDVGNIIFDMYNILHIIYRLIYPAHGPMSLDPRDVAFIS